MSFNSVANSSSLIVAVWKSIVLGRILTMSELRKEGCDLLTMSTRDERFGHGHTCALYYFVRPVFFFFLSFY